MIRSNLRKGNLVLFDKNDSIIYIIQYSSVRENTIYASPLYWNSKKTPNSIYLPCSELNEKRFTKLLYPPFLTFSKIIKIEEDSKLFFYIGIIGKNILCTEIGTHNFFRLPILLTLKPIKK